jgi:hypothetical protein
VWGEASIYLKGITSKDWSTRRLYRVPLKLVPFMRVAQKGSPTGAIEAGTLHMSGKSARRDRHIPRVRERGIWWGLCYRLGIHNIRELDCHFFTPGSCINKLLAPSIPFIMASRREVLGAQGRRRAIAQRDKGTFPSPVYRTAVRSKPFAEMPPRGIRKEEPRRAPETL